MFIILVLLVIIIAGILFLNFNTAFGGDASKKDKKDYEKRSENYMNGKFIYPAEFKLVEEKSDNRVSNKGKSPKEVLPVVKPLFNEIHKDECTITWLGHSSLLIQIHGMNILIDPVFSKRTSPISFIGPKRFAELPISVEELPAIDMVIIFHDHYDHLDMKSIKQLDSKVKKYIVPLGVEKHLERWNIKKTKIENMAWWEETEINGLTIACTPANHFSGRKLYNMSSTLYASWVLKDEDYKIYESADGGFGGHFEEIHKRYGDFDLAIMECGQYNMRWYDIHMFPEESVKAATMLYAKIAMPIHWGTFVLSNHGWNDSVERFLTEAEKTGVNVLVPKIGETVKLDKYMNYQDKWWKEIQ